MPVKRAVAHGNPEGGMGERNGGAFAEQWGVSGLIRKSDVVMASAFSEQNLKLTVVL